MERSKENYPMAKAKKGLYRELPSKKNSTNKASEPF